MARCAHMAGPCQPTWMPTWSLRGVNSDIGRTGLKSCNRTVGIKSRNWTAEITRSGIRVMGHDHTDYARSDG